MKDLTKLLAALDVFPFNLLFVLAIAAVLSGMSMGLAPIVRVALNGLVSVFPGRPPWPPWLAILTLLLLFRLALTPYSLVRAPKDPSMQPAKPLRLNLVAWRRLVMPVLDCAAAFVMVFATAPQPGTHRILFALTTVNPRSFILLAICMFFDLVVPIGFLSICDVLASPRNPRLSYYSTDEYRRHLFITWTLVAIAFWSTILVYFPAFCMFAIFKRKYPAFITVLICLLVAKAATAPITAMISYWMDRRHQRGEISTGQP